MNKKNIDLVFVGRKSTLRHFEYIYRFNKKLKQKDWIHHLELPYEQMPTIYKFAKVCVSASWFETTGLTSLEALFCNTNAVASGERAKEYLGHYVSYCEPDNIESIQSAIAKEYFAPRPNVPSEDLKSYTWENAAKQTLEVYKSLI
jgi:glycosyltransferase involved in cell wall biosynthesis